MSVCTPVAERCFWVRRALDSGKVPVVELPVGLQARETIDLARRAAMAPALLAVAGDAASTGSSLEVVKAVKQGDLGTPLYVRLQIAVPRCEVAGHREGVLARSGIRYVRLLTAACGPLDSVLARTRALATNCPAEDLAVVQLRFANGVEGLFEVTGIGRRASAEITIQGSAGERTWSLPPPARSSADLHGIYGALVTALSGSSRLPCGGHELQEIALLAAWISQSARLDSEVWKGDVEVC